MKWSELKKEVDEILKGEDIDIIYLFSGNYPKKVKIKKYEDGLIIDREDW
jgi:hypothetical protein